MSEQEKFSNYADPNVLVTADWVHERLEEFQSNDSNLRLVEVDVDTEAYDEEHIPGAVGWDWESELCDQVQRDLVPKEDFDELLENSGISNDTTIVLYGDNHNWFAAWAFWQLKYYGHDDVRLMDGGRAKWLELDYPLSTDVPNYPEESYSADQPNESIRTYAPDIEDTLDDDDLELVDVRSEEEFTGEKIAPEGMSETAQRGGHIPGATNISWSEAVNEDSTFKSRDELEEIYESRGITDNKKTVAYCRIGERSSHSWFVLHFLLGHDNVVNYDGSWTEWGNRVGAPIETGK
jgi:thiosulfate/3-mercaptopyruvate sulfurtransferase